MGVWVSLWLCAVGNVMSNELSLLLSRSKRGPKGISIDARLQLTLDSTVERRYKTGARGGCVPAPTAQAHPPTCPTACPPR